MIASFVLKIMRHTAAASAISGFCLIDSLCYGPNALHCAHLIASKQ